jgi:hypothetical protein
MMNRIFLLAMVAITAASCGSVEITKRRHMPGYHVDLGRQHRSGLEQPERLPHAERSAVETVVPVAAMLPVERISDDVLSAVPLTASASQVALPATANRAGERGYAMTSQPMSAMGEEGFAKRLRTSVFPTRDEEKFGWSTLSFIGFGLGVAAFATGVVGIAFLAMFGPLWFVPAVVALLFGISALIVGIFGIRDASRRSRRGRGFAIAGVAAGGFTIILCLFLLFIGGVLTLAGV